MTKEYEAEAELWMWVIIQAFVDASMPLPKPKPGFRYTKAGKRTLQYKEFCIRSRMAKAREWLLENESDFGLVCEMAGMRPEKVRESARRFAADGWPKLVDNALWANRWRD